LAGFGNNDFIVFGPAEIVGKVYTQVVIKLIKDIDGFSHLLNPVLATDQMALNNYKYK